jgi:hypothetical protein
MTLTEVVRVSPQWLLRFAFCQGTNILRASGKENVHPCCKWYPLLWITSFVVFRTQTLTLTRCFSLRKFNIVVAGVITHDDGESNSTQYTYESCHLRVSFQHAEKLACELSHAWRNFYMQSPGFLTFDTWPYSEV